ncbi:hypothetical protein EV44_g2899 [Erysiphe necator]|uniref:Chromo domain-containing protein n=1 Tax=Uncinula necator TaxID=52586 RepID=A0A0B1P2G2_UNCNE|nr:hypothetical protein EV44_g2899 [Erysiphe necator]
MLETDASDGVVAGVLSQKHGDDWLPVAFFSKTLAPAELNYAVYDKEMLAIARWSEVLADFNFLISYRPGVHNPLADTLTRRINEVDSQNLAKKSQRLQQLLRDNQVDPVILLSRELRTNTATEALINSFDLKPISTDLNIVDMILKANRNSSSLQALRKQATSNIPGPFSMENGLLLYNDRLIVPDTNNLRTLIIREAHDQISSAHLSAKKTLRLLPKRNYWKGMSNHISQYCRNCHLCRRSSVPLDKKPGFLHQLPIPSRPWEHVTMDFCCFNKDKHGYDKVLVIIDRFSKQAISMPAKLKSSPSRGAGVNAQPSILSISGIAKNIRTILPFRTPIHHRGSQSSSFLHHSPLSTFFHEAPHDWPREYRVKGSILSQRTSDENELLVQMVGCWLDFLEVFISAFWNEFNKILGTKVKLSTANHPQTDGQTEIYNQYLQKRLRLFVNYYQNNWSELLPIMDYAQLILPHDSLGGLSPFEIVHGYPARTTWDWKIKDDVPPPEKLDIEDARKMIKQQHDAWSLAKSHLLQAQSRMARKSNIHRREINFDVGDYVWLDMRDFLTQRPTKKLDFPTNGKFLITEKVGNSFRLALPTSMKVHNIFPPEKLRLASSDLLPGQINDEPLPINITGDDEWEIEKVLASRVKRQRLEYRVAWLNKDEDLDWISASDLKYAPHKIKEFHLQNPNQRGPPAQLLQ